MRAFFAASVLLSAATVAGAATIHSETIDGDLSSDPANPTALATSPGVNTIIGSTVFSPIDRDFFKVTIDPGETLAAIVLADYQSSPPNNGFLAVEAGPQISSIVSPATFLGTALIGAAGIGTDVLDDVGLASLGGAGFVGALGPGEYTFWFQETAADVSYQFDLHITPEPTSMALLGIGIAMIGALSLHRRRKFAA